MRLILNLGYGPVLLVLSFSPRARPLAGWSSASPWSLCYSLKGSYASLIPLLSSERGLQPRSVLRVCPDNTSRLLLLEVVVRSSRWHS